MRFENDFSDEEPLLAARKANRRHRETDATSSAERRREVCSLALSPMLVNSFHGRHLQAMPPRREKPTTPITLPSAERFGFQQTNLARSHCSNPQETVEERQVRTQQHRAHMVGVREAARNEADAHDVTVHEAALALGPLQRPSLDMLHQFEQSAVCAQLFFAEGSGFDVHNDCFEGEVASLHLDPVPFARNDNTTVEQSSQSSDGIGDGERILPQRAKDWEISERLLAYHRAMGPDISISACASCGIKELGVEYKSIPVDQIDCLYTEGERKKRYLEAGELQAVFHVMLEDNNLYDLHQELVLLPTPLPYRAPLRAPLCESCYADVSKGRRPTFNVGNIDFGRRVPEIAALTDAEELAISRSIRFQTIIKLRSNSTPSCRGHVISFPDDAPEVMAQTLPRLDMQQYLSISFVGTKELYLRTTVGGSRNRFIKAHPQISVNIERLYYALRLKRQLDPAYCNIEIDESPATIQYLQNLTTDLLDPDNVIFVDSDEATELDTMVESNVARPEPEQAGITASEVVDGDDDDQETPMERMFVSRPVISTTTDVSTVLRATGRAVYGHDEAVSISATVAVDETPVDEFHEGDLFFLGSFPLLFLFGQGADPGTGGISTKRLRHMLLQAHNQFATNAPFIFTVFNQLQRHSASRSVSLKVKGSRWSMQQFMDIINSDDFSQRLAAAIENPTTQESKALAGAILTVARVPGAKVPWSALERKTAMYKLMAIMQYTGAFSIFGTIAPADMDSALMLRLSCTPPNSETGVFADAEDGIKLKLPGLVARHKILANNPVAAAQVYGRLVENLFALLIGLPTSHTTRKSPPPVRDRGQGLLGVPIAFGGVTEAQARHSPHLHFLLATDITPITIQKYCDNPEVLKLLCARLDSILCANIPLTAKELVEPIVADNLSEPTPKHRDTRTTVDFENATKADVDERGNGVAFSANRHQHSLTCHKGPTGRFRCRLSMGRAIWSRETEVLQLLATYDTAGKMIPKALRHIQQPSDMGDPLQIWNDHRVLVLELHRPHATFGPDAHTECSNSACAQSHPDSACTNQYYVDIVDDGTDNTANAKVVTFSPALSAILACNTDIEPLGTFAQAKAAIFYLVKYITKDGNDLANVLSLIEAAKDHCIKYPSRADDAGTETRNAKYILTRLLNCLSGDIEMGAQLSALALIDFPSNVFSHEFYYCFVYSAINHCRSVHKHTPPTPFGTDPIPTSASTTENAAAEWDFSVDVGGDGDVIEAVGVDNSINDADEDAENKEITRDDDDNIVFVCQSVDYKYRAPTRLLRIEDPAVVLNHQCATNTSVDDLGELSLYEYTAIVRTRRRTQASDKKCRKLDRVYEFHADHPSRSERVQQLRSRQFIPQLAGRPSPPHPGPESECRSWRQAADRFAAYAITLHCPWSLVTLAPPIPLTWDALEAWVACLAESDNYIDAARLHWLRLLAQGRTVKSETIKLLSAWRSRGTTYWSKADRTMAAHELCEEGATDLDLDDIINEMQDNDDGLAPIKKDSNAYQHRQAVMSHLHRLSKQVSSRNPPLPRNCVSSTETRLDETVEGQAATIVERILRKSSAIEAILSSAPQHTSNIALSTESTALPRRVDEQHLFDDTVPSDLNEKQAAAFKEIVAWANADAHHRTHLYSPAPPPLHLLISGAAGTGKTHLVRKLYERLGSDVIVSVSITGVAASNLPKGATIHSTFAMPVSDRVKPSESTACTKFGDARILIIDEISTTQAEAFAWVSNILRRWFEANLSFGGLAVIAMGDFFQQGPVGRSLIQACMINGNVAGELFKAFKRVEFTQQQRVADDPAHSDRLDFFRDPSRSLRPVLASKILDHLKIIAVDDLLHDEKFMSAPIITSNNVTRHAINKHKAIEMALRLGQPVIAFRLPLANFTKSVFIATARRIGSSVESLLDEHDNLTFFFVVGAPVICKDNISPSFGIANGAQATLHSITLDASLGDTDEVWNTIDAAKPGEIVLLNDLPLSINIQLNGHCTNIDPTTSMLPDVQVIPMLLNTRSPRKLQVAAKKQHQRQLTYFDFGIDLAFALTYFKVQGLTLDRVILDLNTTVNPKINVAAIYVGLSRVRHGTHIRILPVSNDCRLALNRLEFRRYLVDWLANSSAT